MWPRDFATLGDLSAHPGFFSDYISTAFETTDIGKMKWIIRRHQWSVPGLAGVSHVVP